MRQFVVQVAADFFFGLSGRPHAGMVGRHRSHQGGRTELCVDQPVLEPPQRGMRIQQAIRHGHQPAGIVFGLGQDGQQLPVALFRRGVLAELAADVFAAPPQGAVAAGHLLHRSQLGQVAAHAMLGRSQGGGRFVQVGLRQANRLAQFVDHARALASRSC